MLVRSGRREPHAPSFFPPSCPGSLFVYLVRARNAGHPWAPHLVAISIAITTNAISAAAVLVTFTNTIHVVVLITSYGAIPVTVLITITPLCIKIGTLLCIILFAPG
jgi:hypothetical protein